jgi:hypothetical protein
MNVTQIWGEGQATKFMQNINFARLCCDFSLYCNINIVPFRIDLLIAIQLSVLLSPIRSTFSKFVCSTLDYCEISKEFYCFPVVKLQICFHGFI